MKGKKLDDAERGEPNFGNLDGEMSASQVAARLKVHLCTLERWRARKVGPKFVRRGGRVTYREEDVEAYLRDGDRHVDPPVRRKARPAPLPADLPRVPPAPKRLVR